MRIFAIQPRLCLISKSYQVERQSHKRIHVYNKAGHRIMDNMYAATYRKYRAVCTPTRRTRSHS